MNYETWRLTFQSAEQAAKSAFEDCKQLEQQNAELTKERDELLAYCEIYRDAITTVSGEFTEITNDAGSPVFNLDPQDFHKFISILDVAPQQSLANIQTNAVIEELEDLSM